MRMTGDDSLAIVPSAGIEGLLLFLELAGFCTAGENGAMEMLPQTVLGYIELFEYPLELYERQIVCSLTQTYASAVHRYRENPDAVDPYAEFLEGLGNG